MDLFDTAGYADRWSGPGWQDAPAWGWLHIAADVLAFAAFTAIAASLIYFARRRRDVPFPRVLRLFIWLTLACSLLQLLDVLTFWWPIIRFAAVAKLFTATMAWAALFALIYVVPKALAFRSPAQLEDEVRARTRELKLLAKQQQRESDERDRIAAWLRESEERLRLALQAGGMGTWDWNLVTGITHYDETEIALCGLDAPDGFAPAEEFLSRIHPEDIPGVREALQRAFDGVEDYNREFRIILPDGRYRWLLGHGRVIRDENNQAVRIVGVNYDVTERRQAEENLRLRTRAIESATNGIFIIDARLPQRPIIYVNPAFEELTGYQADDILNRSCDILYGSDTDPSAIETLERALVEGEGCEVVLLNYRKDGSSFWSELHLAPVEDSDHRISHFVGIQSDVTNRVRHEQELRQAEQHAELANRAKSEFLANMSHEIRTPLTAILGCADTLFDQLEEENALDLVHMIRSQGRLLLGILNDVLDLSKIEAGRLEIHHEPCSVTFVVNEVRSLMEPLAQERGLTLTSSFDSTIPVTIHSDALRIRQILLNLVSNAIKFTEEGSVHISVSCRADDAGQAQLSLSVRDTGIGIAPDKVEAIFEAFSQHHEVLTRKVGGTGLGLTICQRLCYLLGGHITVESRHGVGSTFTVTLPVGNADELRFAPADEISNQQLHTAETSVGLDLSDCRMLVAEDTRGIQFLLQRMLEGMVGYVNVVSNGQEALDEMQRAEAAGEPYDLVLMDMQMPVLNGFDATRRLREDDNRTPVIALTAGAMKGDREKCLAAGCDDYLSKPFDWEQLMSVIRRNFSPRRVKGEAPTRA